jgi:flagellin
MGVIVQSNGLSIGGLVNGRVSDANEPRNARGAAPERAVQGAAAPSYTTDLSAVRAAIAAASSAMDAALAAGREGAGVLAQAADIARAGAADPDLARLTQAQALPALMQRYAQIVDSVLEVGGGLLAGATLRLPADPDTGPVDLVGEDIRIGGPLVRADAREPSDVAREAQANLARVEAALGRLSGAAQKIGAHSSLLDALDSSLANNVVAELNAESARLLALDVSQKLAGERSSIANAGPQAILALFRA